MSNSIIQLPYTGTTSGQLLDSEQVSVGGNTVERERMQISGAAASAIAPVTSSGGLIVTLSTVPQNVVSASSGLIQISGTATIVSASSGLVQISGTPTIVSASSGLVQISGTATIVSASSGLVQISGAVVTASSGLVQVLQSTGIWAVLTASSGSNQVFVTGSSGAIATVTSSAGLLVDILRPVTLAFASITATSSGTTTLVSASGSSKVKVVSYVIVSNSTNEIAFYSSDTPIIAASSAPMVLSSYSGIAIAGDRQAWLTETSAGGDYRIYLGNAGIVSGNIAYFYEV